jgi:hypothetical protein
LICVGARRSGCAFDLDDGQTSVAVDVETSFEKRGIALATIAIPRFSKLVSSRGPSTLTHPLK